MIYMGGNKITKRMLEEKIRDMGIEMDSLHTTIASLRECVRIRDNSIKMLNDFKNILLADNMKALAAVEEQKKTIHAVVEEMYELTEVIVELNKEKFDIGDDEDDCAVRRVFDLIKDKYNKKDEKSDDIPAGLGALFG